MSAAAADENGAANDDVGWTPPGKVEDLYAKASGNRFASINRPTAGPREDVPLPCGENRIQLYSLSTPNGIKVSILLEELGVDYDAHKVNIMSGMCYLLKN